MSNKKETEFSTPIIKQRINSLLTKRADELATIKEKEAQKKEALAAAEKALHDATERTDIEAYNSAKKAAAEAMTALEMYSARYQQLYAEEFMSEEESDRVIDGLLDYEEFLASEYMKKISVPLKNLQELHNRYRADILETEETINAWTSQIHKNFRRIASGYKNERSDEAVPVRYVRYIGIPLSYSVEKLLNQNDVKELINDN